MKFKSWPLISAYMWPVISDEQQSPLLRRRKKKVPVHNPQRWMLIMLDWRFGLCGFIILIQMAEISIIFRFFSFYFFVGENREACCISYQVPQCGVFIRGRLFNEISVDAAFQQRLLNQFWRIDNFKGIAQILRKSSFSRAFKWAGSSHSYLVFFFSWINLRFWLSRSRR